jgi:hypothetical protein
MYVVHKFTTNQFEPISQGANYLYAQYDKVLSFLKKQFSDLQYDSIAKPVLASGEVLWYAPFESKLDRLSQFSEEVQQNIKVAYWTMKEEVDGKVAKLMESSNPAEHDWGSLLAEVFNDENNILVTDGDRWCILWGWKFSNRQENYLAPEFLPSAKKKKPELILPSPEPSSPVPGPLGQSGVITPIPEDEPPLKPQTVVTRPRRAGFWIALTHFLRRMIYRIWGLLLFIILLLFLSCLLSKCKLYKCSTSSGTNNDTVLQQRISDLEQRIQEKCK